MRIGSSPRIASYLGFLLVACGFANAQQVSPKPQIRTPINESQLTPLKGNTHPAARSQFDRGLAPANLPLNRMLLVLKRSPQEEGDLRTLLDDQQNKSSPNYHHWLTPDEFGQQFGPADQDLQIITSWLGSHGFKVNRVSRGRTVVEFSGTAGQLLSAFHTEIHQYRVGGKQHWANSSDPAIPTALAPVVAGITSLHDFPRKPLYHLSGGFSRDRPMGQYSRLATSASPTFTGGTSCGLNGTSCFAVSPYDFATIYSLLPLWNANPPIDGTGQSIAIVSQSDIYPWDVSDFHADFGLPAPNVNVIHDGIPPGNLATAGDELESDLDVEWASSIAKGATIQFVVSASTNTTAGVDLSAEYIVDNDVAPVMSESYGACELDLGTAGNQFFSQLWQQAAAEGITVFVASGDSGSAVCDQNTAIATTGLAVNGISSTPYNVSVGGTDFDDLQNPGMYWNSTNAQTTQASAKSYIPETTWNDSCTNSEFFQFTGQANAESACNDSASFFSPSFLAPVAGSGGASNCTLSTNQSSSSCAGGYTKPSWQMGPGVPNDGKRDVPDVSLFAGNGLNANMYMACETELYGGCTGDPYNMVRIGGTSASAPAMAAIMALVNQKTQSRQGNANYVFYQLAARPGASCDSSGTLSSGCIFYDVTKGTIAMPCVTGTPNCVTQTAGNQNGVLSGFDAGAGYDLATGLGSVNVTNLVSNWDSVSFQPTNISLALAPTAQINHGSAVNVSITVAPTSGSGTPTGQVSLVTSTGQLAGTFTLVNGSVSASTRLLPGGSYTVTAHYAGDGTFAASDSSPSIAVSVLPETSVTTLQAFTLDQTGGVVPYTTGPYGVAVIYVRADVAGQSGQGVPTGAVTLSGTPAGISSYFPSNPYPLNSEASAMAPLPGGYLYHAFTPGTYSVVANYSGDGSFNSGTSTTNFAVTKAATTTTLSIYTCISQPGQCKVNPGQTVMIGGSAISHGFSANPPTGTMTFFCNGVQLGSPASVDTSVNPPGAGLSTTQLPLGIDSITVQYSGDSNYTGSTSPVGTIQVGSTFSISASPTVISIARPGQSGSTTLTFTGQTGMTGTAPLDPSTCSNLPPYSWCSFNPSTVTFSSSATTIPVTLTISTRAPGSTLSAGSGRGTHYGLRGLQSVAPLSLMSFGFAFVVVGKKRHIRKVGALVGLLVISLWIGCGGGTGSNGGGGGAAGTPVGTYAGVTVTVTINGVTESVNNLTVNVQ